MSLHFDFSWVLKTLTPTSLLQKGTAQDFEAITTDSRKVRSGQLFVAIRGEKLDGHDFIEASLQSGATGILGERTRLEALLQEKGNLEHFKKAHFFGVSQVDQAYRQLGSAWRNRFSIPVVLVAGSNGKTTTKELLAAILQGKWSSVLKTTGSQNGFLGIPMTLLELRSQHQAAVVEVGIDDVGAMIQHVDSVCPTHAVLTVIGPEHLENLKDIPTVAREELLSLTETLRKGGKIAIHLDDPWIAPVAQITEKTAASDQTITFSLENTKATLLGSLDSNHQLTVRIGSESLRLSVPLPGRHNAQNLMAAVSVAHQLELTADEILRGLNTFSGAEGRSQIRDLQPKRKVICDYYNASPVSMKAAFELLSQTGSPHSDRWACLADMKELGDQELQFHRDLAPLLLSSSLRGVLLTGPRMVSLQDELLTRGYAGVLKHFESPESLADFLKTQLTADSVVLIKGSRSMKMERVWESLQK